MKLACIQMTTARDPAESLPVIEVRVRAAVAAGATLVALPETCVFMEKGAAAMRSRLQVEAENPALDALCTLAADLQIWLLIGSMILANESDGDARSGKAVNRSLLVDPQGKVRARYDKIHMFDVTLADGERYHESAHYEAGAAAVLSSVCGARLGFTICYDVRFPALYRRLAEAGADLIFVPSAFTRPTGAAHWHVLLRARAIETGCFIIAPAQVGRHENGRETYGHSLIIDPWGRVLAEAGDEDRFIIAEIDLAEVARARGQIPSLTHGRRFALPNQDGRRFALPNQNGRRFALPNQDGRRFALSTQEGATQEGATQEGATQEEEGREGPNQQGWSHD